MLLLPQLREEVEQRMLANGFSDYEDLAKWVSGQGYDISDDSLRRYGKSLNQEFAATYIGTSAVHRGFPRIAALPSGFSDLRLGEATKICWREIAEPQRSAFRLYSGWLANRLCLRLPPRQNHPMHYKRIAIALGAIVLLFLAINLGLHFGQKAHDHLDYNIDQAYPAGKPFVPGEIYASTLAAIMDHELHGGFGWRPNDFFLWGPHLMADNNADRQLGIIMAVRETMRVFKDHLTKISSNEYDDNLVTADTDFRNDATKWMLPSAEHKYADGVQHLRLYVAGLHQTPPRSSLLNQRNIELLRLFQAWTDLLGDAHAMLYQSRKPDGTPIYPWDGDDYFYHAQGYAHVMYYMMMAVKREYSQTQKTKPVVATLFDETIDPLGKAATMKPLMVLNGSPDGLFANHRRNLDAYISEARQKMYSIREELQQ